MHPRAPYPKETARQLGATRFYHNEAIDTLDKAINHIERPVGSILKGLGTKWLTANRPMYDTAMHATTANRLPLALRELVSERPEEVKSLLMSWLEIEELPQTSRGSNLARRALEQEPDQPEEEVTVESLSAELEAKDAEILRLKEDNRKYRAMLRIALDEMEE